MICKGYFQVMREYVIYSLRAQPEMNEACIPLLPKNNMLIFQMVEVSEL